MKYKISNNKVTSKTDISGIIIKGLIDQNSINKERRIFSGFGSVAVIDRQGDYLPIHEFKPVMEKLMQRGAPVTDSHSNHVVGKIVDYTYKPTETGELGLYLTAEIYNHYPSDEETWHKIQDGEYTGFSLGGKAGTKTPTCTNIGCYNILGDIEAWEFSIVERPANQLANIDKVNKLAKASNIVDEIIYTITKDGHIIQKPFANYKDFVQCVTENKDKGDPNTYCGAIKHKVEKRADFTLNDAKRIGNQLNIDWTKIDQNEFLIGLNIELEHGTKFSETNVTDDDEIKTAKITLAHLNEFPDYYNEGNGLPEMEKRLKGIKKEKVYVDNPQDAPKDKRVQEGKRGGLYYESEGIPKQEFPKQDIYLPLTELYNLQDTTIEHAEPKDSGNVSYFIEAAGDIYREVSGRQDGSYIREKLNKLKKFNKLTIGDEIDLRDVWKNNIKYKDELNIFEDKVDDVANKTMLHNFDKYEDRKNKMIQALRVIKSIIKWGKTGVKSDAEKDIEKLHLMFQK